MRRLQRACAIGLMAGGLGALLALTPLGAAVEERFGLGWLFAVRGARAPPADAVVVSLDRDSAEQLGLPDAIRDWPRTVHARVIERLVAAGAAVIVFDVIFDRARDPANDQALAQAVADADRVVLVEFLEESFRPLPGADGALDGLVAEKQLRPPLPAFALGAVGAAPFPLPRMSEQVSHFWAFATELDAQPTLPAVALQRYAMPVFDDWTRLLSRAGLPAVRGDLVLEPERLAAVEALTAYMQTLRLAFVQDPDLGGRLRAELAKVQLASRTRRLLAALIALYDGPDSRYLDFYGPPGQVSTLPLHQLLQPADGSAMVPDLAGKVVFVGLSELINANQDGFTTVFEGPKGARMGGVEIAATALANLLDGRLLEPAGLGLTIAWTLGFGALVGLIAGLLPALLAVLLALAFAGVGYLGAELLFARADLWLPVTVPILVQLPLGLFGGLLLQYREAHRAQANISAGLRYYLPASIAAGLADTRVDPGTLKEHLFAACMVTDAERFTQLAEGMAPEQLSGFLDRYFETLFRVAERHGGLVTDVVGDGMTCIWTAPGPAPECRRRACLAALDIQQGVADFNRRFAPLALPTRIGLNAGPVMVGNVGGGRRFTYSVVGDNVNSAARLEGLNKQLGTRILGTEAAVAGLPELLLRPLGRFLPVGKTQPLRLAEIVGRRGDAYDAPLLEAFAEALARFEAERFAEAAACFEAIVAGHPTDGPARFFLGRCRSYLVRGSLPPDPALIRLEQK